MRTVTAVIEGKGRLGRKLIRKLWEHFYARSGAHPASVWEQERFTGDGGEPVAVLFILPGAGATIPVYDTAGFPRLTGGSS